MKKKLSPQSIIVWHGIITNIESLSGFITNGDLYYLASDEEILNYKSKN